jgi:hypothetical protein
MLHMMRFLALTFRLALSVTACTDDTRPAVFLDSGKSDTGVSDLSIVVHDVYPQPKDGSKGDLVGCQVGTPDHCKSCGNKCPGVDNEGTARACTAGSCSIVCKGEYYDVNGSVDDGCEFQDDLPLHELVQNAMKLPSVEDCEDNLQQALATIPSDNREHQDLPESRANGRIDWFQLSITDKAFCEVQAETTIDCSGLPKESIFEVTVYYLCDSGKQLGEQTAKVNGGSSITLQPNTGCTLFSASSDSGTVFVKVEKLSGPHSAKGYWLQILP